VLKKNPPINRDIESSKSEKGTPKLTRPIMAIGEVKGIMDSQKETLLLGSFNTNTKRPK
jgi:hypothetical protein